jgi:hypothetical protein
MLSDRLRGLFAKPDAGPVSPESDFSGFPGRWLTTFGPMTLEAQGGKIAGSYRYANNEGHLEGVIAGDTLDFSYSEPREQGVGRFRLLRPGKFIGSYTVSGDDRPRRWEGERGWDGIWDSDFGRMRLLHEAGRIHGFYEGAGASVIEGRLHGPRFEFQYREGNASGEGWFELGADAHAFAGEWRQQGGAEWSPWRGARMQAEPGLTWLVVLEAHWQRSLAESEYAFGHMLREVFARLPGVRVRQRFFHDGGSLEHWCRELLYLPEPAILMIASHGVAEGLSVHGQVINTTRVLESLRYAESLRLLHFSSCLVGLDGERALTNHPYPVSGYTTSVDWGASALLEFTYLDLILNRGLGPAEAAARLPELVSYAGDSVAEGSPYPAAGFRFFPGR